MKRMIIMLSCIATVVITTFVGTKSFLLNAYKANSLLTQNVEALSLSDRGEEGDISRIPDICYYESRVKKGWAYINCINCEIRYDEMGIGEPGRCSI